MKVKMKLNSLQNLLKDSNESLYEKGKKSKENYTKYL